MRRNRKAPWARELVAEHRLSARDLIWPMFVIEGKEKRVPVASMPGVERLSVDLIVETAKEAVALGIPAVALFPFTDPAKRSDDAREAFNADNLVCRATRAIKAAKLDLGIILDVALDPYTSHGHDGLLVGDEIVNDETNAALVKQALVQARAGADVLAPSDMMDGRIAAIRRALDEARLPRTVLMSYAAKFHSALYGPFRVAAESTPRAGALKDRSSYQLDPARPTDAWQCAERDAAEGADILMVKPGLPYLDLLRELSQAIKKPWAVYHVSGEFAALEALAAQGLANRAALHREVLTAFRRAGASMIITYGARYAREWLDA